MLIDKDHSRSAKPFRVFLSYSSEQHSIAEQVYFAMTTSGHDVFFDRTDLPAGDEYNQAILDRIRTSDLMVFLISPESICEGAYTRTELRFACDTWPNPRNHVLPVLAVPTEFSDIPNYLKAVTVLRPEGNLTAEVSAKVNDIAAGRTPQDTIAGKAELIGKLSEETERLRRSQVCTEIDNRWAREKQRYVVTVNEKEMLPSAELAVLSGVGFSVFSLIGYVGFTSSNADFFGWSPVIMPLVMGAVSSLFIYGRARQFKRAEKEYLKRRRAALSNKLNDDLRLFSDLTKR